MSDDNLFSFVWKIENFSMLPHQFGEKLVSPTFVVDAWKKNIFCLELYPKGELKEGIMSLFLSKEPRDNELKLNFTLAVESIKPSDTIQQTVTDLLLKTDLGYKQLVSVTDIYAKKKLFLPQDTLTLRCEISPPEETASELNVNQESKCPSKFLRMHCVSRTCIQVEKRSIVWSIRNVKESLQRQENASIIFKSALRNSPSLKLTLNFNKIKSDKVIPIMIKQSNVSLEQLFVQCKITVASTLEEHQTSKTSSYLFKLSSDVWIFPSFLTTSMLTDEKYLKVDDTMFLRFEFAFSYRTSMHHLENNYIPCVFETRPKNSELSTYFENVYGSGKFYDVELHAGGRTFPYYKLVLCTRSSVFSAMFENNMKEKESNVVEIEDVQPDTLQRMLTYMLSDVLQEDLLAEDVCSLYRAADKYDMACLKKRCSVLLATFVSVLNVCDLLVHADVHHDSFLMAAVWDFICNHTTEVCHSAQWEIFMQDYQELSCKVMHKMLTGCRFGVDDTQMISSDSDVDSDE